MSEQKPIKKNYKLLALDAIGSLTMALGAAEHFEYLSIIPEKWKFEHYAFYLIGFGFLLTLPYIIDVYKQKTGKKPREI
ncbi:MAG: hypothetical protein HWD86_11900 [Kangiellaceae bacterium]|nr:hypothetical protein [Kangiellaceae bacterium]